MGRARRAGRSGCQIRSDEITRVVFDRLGVFTGSFDASSAQAVVSGAGIAEWDVLDALGDLVAKSDLTRSRASSSIGSACSRAALTRVARRRSSRAPGSRNGTCSTRWAIWLPNPI